MNCLRVRENIKAYIDGELGPITRLRVQRHLDTCGACREEMIAMSEITTNVQNSQAAPTPEGLRAKVLGSIDIHPQPAPCKWWATAPSLASFAVLAVIGVGLSAVLLPTFQSAKRSAGVSALESQKQIGRLEPQLAAKPSVADMRPRLARSQVATTSAPAGDGLYRSGGNAGDPSESLPSAASLMIIKTADISIQVKSFDRASDEAVAVGKSAGGYVTDSSADTTGNAPTSGRLTIRVPVSAFERTLARLSKLGKIMNKSISGEDVTGEAVDLESRLRNKRAEERQYLEIMNRAKRIADIVTVTNELSRVRGEIEEAQGRLKYLKNSSAMSTISLSLSEKAKPKPHASALGGTWSNAVSSFSAFLANMASVLIWLAVFSPFWALPIGAWLYLRKRLANVNPPVPSPGGEG